MPLCSFSKEHKSPCKGDTAYCGEVGLVPTWDQTQLSSRESEQLHTRPIDLVVKTEQFTLMPRRERTSCQAGVQIPHKSFRNFSV